ncbi:MAG: hypothetical protein K2M97_05705 [Muribaculaceae bacterium]|nr:hypothetical protein [Muribaculaceae bacterium]
MKRVYKYLLIALAAGFIVSLTSCGKDEDDNEPDHSESTSLVVNGIKGGRIYNAQCSSKKWSEDWGDEYTVSFYLQFDYNSEMTAFSITWPFNRASLKKGMDLLETDWPETMSFRGITTMEIDPRYEDYSGQVIVESISNDKITLRFVDFRFFKSLGNKTYLINGTVTYGII